MNAVRGNDNLAELSGQEDYRRDDEAPRRFSHQISKLSAIPAQVFQDARKCARWYVAIPMDGD